MYEFKEACPIKTYTLSSDQFYRILEAVFLRTCIYLLVMRTT